jgi:hypothetical protein
MRGKETERKLEVSQTIQTEVPTEHTEYTEEI